MLTIVSKVMVLQAVDVFSEVPTKELSLLAAIAHELNVPAGEIVYEQNAPSDSMFMVVSGAVRLHRDGQDLTMAKANETFGTWALFDDEPRVATATVAHDATLLRIDKEEFVELLADNVALTMGVLKAVVGRLRRLAARVGADPMASRHGR